MKKELRKIAKKRIMEALSVAYYHFSDGCNEEYNDLSEDEQQQVMKLLDQYGKAIGKMLGEEYYTSMGKERILRLFLILKWKKFLRRLVLNFPAKAVLREYRQ